MNVVIRHAVSFDLPDICAIDSRAFAYPWSKEDFEQALLQRLPTVLIVADGRTAGFCVMLKVLDTAEILTFAIDPSLQRKGLGRTLLAHCLADLDATGVRQTFLEVREGNTAAQKLYGLSGFACVGRRKGYYPAPGGREDALLMRRDAPGRTA